MMATVEVRVAFPLRKVVGGTDPIQARGETVQHLLGDLDSQFPGFKERLIDSRGELNGSFLILLNDEDIRSLKGIETPLKDSDVVSILVIMLE